MSVLMPVMHCFVLSFEIRKYESSIFVAFSQDCYSYLGSIQFHMNLRISFTIAAKKAVGISMEMALTPSSMRGVGS